MDLTLASLTITVPGLTQALPSPPKRACAEPDHCTRTCRTQIVPLGPKRLWGVCGAVYGGRRRWSQARSRESRPSLSLKGGLWRSRLRAISVYRICSVLPPAVSSCQMRPQTENRGSEATGYGGPGEAGVSQLSYVI